MRASMSGRWRTGRDIDSDLDPRPGRGRGRAPLASGEAQTILKSSPFAINIRDDWGSDALRTHIEVDQDRASLAGLSSQDIAISSYSAVSGIPVGVMREGRKNIPIVQLMNYGQRDTATALNRLYVYSGQAPQNILLSRVAKLVYAPEPVEIHRVNQYRAITVSALPKPGHVASEATDPLLPRLRQFEAGLPRGYRMEIVGELKEQIKGQRQSLTVVLASVIAIYLALVFQFRNAIKPLIVFAGIPFGAVGALASVWLMHMPVGFLVTLGITSLIGVIVSHVIVLFDFGRKRRHISLVGSGNTHQGGGRQRKTPAQIPDVDQWWQKYAARSNELQESAQVQNLMFTFDRLGKKFAYCTQAGVVGPPNSPAKRLSDKWVGSI